MLKNLAKTKDNESIDKVWGGSSMKLDLELYFLLKCEK